MVAAYDGLAPRVVHPAYAAAMFKRWGVAPVTITNDIGPPFPQRYRRRRAERIAAVMTGTPGWNKPRFRAIRVR